MQRLGTLAHYQEVPCPDLGAGQQMSVLTIQLARYLLLTLLACLLSVSMLFVEPMVQALFNVGALLGVVIFYCT